MCPEDGEVEKVWPTKYEEENLEKKAEQEEENLEKKAEQEEGPSHPEDLARAPWRVLKPKPKKVPKEEEPEDTDSDEWSLAEANQNLSWKLVMALRFKFLHEKPTVAQLAVATREKVRDVFIAIRHSKRLKHGVLGEKYFLPIAAERPAMWRVQAITRSRDQGEDQGRWAWRDDLEEEEEHDSWVLPEEGEEEKEEKEDLGVPEEAEWQSVNWDWRQEEPEPELERPKPLPPPPPPAVCPPPRPLSTAWPTREGTASSSSGAPPGMTEEQEETLFRARKALRAAREAYLEVMAD